MEIVFSGFAHVESVSLMNVTDAPTNPIYSINEINPSKDTTQYTEINERFESSGIRFKKIEKIEIIENETLYLEFCKSKSTCEQYHGNHDVTTMLFHGTRQENVEGICKNGFLVKLAGTLNDSELARNYTGSATVRKMFFAEVVTGNYPIGKKEMTHTPLDTEGHPYDSAVDSLTNPRIFVVFRDSCAYPKYLITYTTDDAV
uniref:protein mono-ADP-ribosyltransferase PARP11-like n=1 Tax=Styela clava TaxID=7725 RepID=UPI00193A0888|nr:protein mono-ADP-ribosyltransferase PARP11-like [Styela clava]